MNIPEWVKPGIYGAAVGGIFVAVVGFTWGGWVTGTTARDMADSMSEDAVIAALVPVCLDQSNADMDRTAKMATIRDAASYQRRDAVMKSGWATVPGAEEPNRNLATACLASLDLETS